ncbi:hypothetical protein LTR28_013584, partial [Elasticomyces elasticus]
QQQQKQQQKHQQPSQHPHPRSNTPNSRSQLEAMPAHFSALSPQPQFSSSPITQHYNPSTRHPVFFTERLRKAPFPLPNAARGSIHPAVEGYILENRREAVGPSGQTTL